MFLSTSLSHGQEEFSFIIKFEDSLGNQDSLILGYDEDGSEFIDGLFNEINIIDLPWQESGLDVRISDVWEGTESFQTKKQILKNDNFELVVIDIKSDNWPITASWDSSIFSVEKIGGTLITSINPGGWWDTGSPSSMERVILREIAAVTFTSNDTSNLFNPNYSYIDNNMDTIPVFWFLFAGDSLSTNINQQVNINQKLHIYPNPTSNYVNLQLSTNNFQNGKWQIYNTEGQLLVNQSLKSNEEVYHVLLDYPSGIYFYSVILDEKYVKSGKIIVTK